ncbi:MAG TPA: hypothetical protein PKD92_13495, partial [Novosphingobium sp.]|nr:hypothetical protein [Novosphingobium sp.]
MAGITLGGLALAGVPATGAPSADAVPAPVIQPLPLTPEAPANEPAPPVPLAEVQMAWSLADARALLAVIETIEAEGLIPADYAPEALRAATAGGEGDALNRAASHSFPW